MSIKRFAAKRDRSEAAIIDALTRVGAHVLPLDTFDLLVLYRGRLHMLECKTGKGRLTVGQQALMDFGWPLEIVRTPEQALQAIGVHR